MFSGMDIVRVEAGTVIKHDGEDMTVTDTNSVRKGRIIYVTPKTYDALKAHPDIQSRYEPSASPQPPH